MPQWKPSPDASPLVRLGLDHIDQGITVFDGDLKLVAWNRQFLKLLRFPDRLAFEGADFESFIRYNAEKGEYGPGDVDRLVDERVAIARTFVAHDFERSAPDGRVLRVAGAPLPEGGFVTVYTDITQEKTYSEELERRVRERTQALRQSEARLKLIADEVPAGIAHLDRDMRFLYANWRFARAYGGKPGDMIGKACADVLHPDTLREAKRFFEQARRGAELDFEMRVRLPDGRKKDIRTFLRPEQPSAGEVIGFYILSVDVTQQKAANEALMQTQKMDALGRLSSGISHDFNNLLAIVLGNLVPMLDRIDDPELRKDYLEPAIAAARRGSALTRRLLSLARAEPVDPEPIQVDRALSEMTNLLRASMPRTVAIEYRRHGRLPLAKVDRSQLEMAVLNLAMNARDAIDSVGLITITLDEKRLGSVEAEWLKLPGGLYLRIRVSDDGVGIAPDLHARVFEPFYTSKPEGDGTGLGLAMVFNFAKQFNGGIRVDSDRGRGTTFTLYLPVYDATDADVEEAAPDRPDVPPGPMDLPLSGDMVLLVEDESEVRRVVRRQLIALGYPVIEAENAAEALDVLKVVDGITLVLSDISMPGEIDGLEFARRLAVLAPHVGVVLMSGQIDWADAAHDVIGCPFVAKPLEDRDLARALAAARPEGAGVPGERVS